MSEPDRAQLSKSLGLMRANLLALPFTRIPETLHG
jgi:hypothetical protein